MATGLRYGGEVRAATPADAPELARLLATDARAMADRLEAVRAHAPSAVLVATRYAGLSGMAALHWAPGLLHPRPVAQVTALVVDAGERRRGIGRLLLKAASQAARAARCDLLLVTPAGEGMEAFCRATGFADHGQALERSLRRRGAD